MLLALVLQAAAPQTAVEAERAFNAAAQARGQWTAFREFAAADAVMFVPKSVQAQGWLKDRKDPVKAIEWWPVASYVSCDGATAVNTGGWQRPDGSVGYFTTVWQRQQDGGWKWLLDGGDRLGTPRPHPADVRVRQARCDGKSRPFLSRAMSSAAAAFANGESKDHSLAWTWILAPDGQLRLSATFWNGTDYETVIDDQIAAPK